MAPLPHHRRGDHGPIGELLQHVGHIDYRGLPLYFGRVGAHRYDAPDRA